jgi:cell wall assembly regulator SMI1
MHRSVLKEIRRTLQVMKRIGRSVDLQPGTTPEKLRSIEAAIGFQFTEDLRDFYQFTNGLDKHFFEGSDVVPWFATGDPYVADYPLTFHSPEEAFSWWSSYKDQPWWEGNQWGEPDPRIQPLLWHRGWFPIASIPGMANTFLFDSNPTKNGKFGQIIEYVHDPDFLYWRFDSFIEFFRHSNTLLEQFLEEDPVGLRRWYGCVD